MAFEGAARIAVKGGPPVVPNSTILVRADCPAARFGTKAGARSPPAAIFSVSRLFSFTDSLPIELHEFAAVALWLVGLVVLISVRGRNCCRHKGARSGCEVGTKLFSYCRSAGVSCIAQANQFAGALTIVRCLSPQLGLRLTYLHTGINVLFRGRTDSRTYEWVGWIGRFCPRNPPKPRKVEPVHCRPHYRPAAWAPHCTLGTSIA